MRKKCLTQKKYTETEENNTIRYEIPDIVFAAFKTEYPKTPIMVSIVTGISPERIKMLVRKWEKTKEIKIIRIVRLKSPIEGDDGSFYTTNNKVWNDFIAGRRSK